MAPTFKHGKGSAFLFNEHDFSQWFSEGTISQSCDVSETSGFGDSDKEYIGGMRDGTASFSGLSDFTTGQGNGPEEKIRGLLASTTPPKVSFGLGGSTIGNRVKMLQGHVTGHEIGVPAQEVVSASVEVQATDRVDSGVWLKGPLSSVTTTGASASVDSGFAAGTTRGGVAHLHITSETNLGSATVKVQHSSAAVSWADLITFTAATGVSVQRSTVAGTVKRYTREIRTALSGASVSVTHAVAFARR